MKKILGISLVAVLAATPLMARAERNVAVANYATPTSTEAVASTSYVQGAYKASSDRIDALVTDTNVATGGNYIDANESVAHNLGELDTAVKTNENAITVLNGDKNVTNSVDYKIDAAKNQLSGDISGLTSRMTTAEGKLDVLRGDANTAGSVAKAEADAKAYTDTQLQSYTNTTDMTTAIATAKSEAISAASTDATTKANSAEQNAKDYVDDKITGLGAVATQGGVDKTIKAVTLTTTGEQSLTGGLSTTGGSFDIATSWTDANAVTTKSFLTSASANYALDGATTVEINDESVSYTTANTTPGSQEQPGA